MPSSCCIKGCSNKQTFYGYSMFGFPVDPDVKEQWVKAIKTDCWEPRSHHRVCEVHFEPDLIHFVGSRKELKKNAVPTLFCNCNCAQSISLAQVKNTANSNMSEKPPVTSWVTSLDHSYTQVQDSSMLTKDIQGEKDCSAKQCSEASSVKRRSWKHTPNCNIKREPLKNTTKIIPETKPEPVNVGISLKKCPPLKIGNAYTGLLNQRISNVKKTRNNLFKLKLQLKSALNENAELKRELSFLKGRMIPVRLLPSNSLKVEQFKKVA